MAKVSYANLKLKINSATEIIKVGDAEIEVKQYLPVEDKYDLIQVTLQKALKDGIYDEFLMDIYFHLGIVYLYTNLSFTDKQKEDEFKLYDALASSGVLMQIIEAMDEAEYSDLLDTLSMSAANNMKYGSNFGLVAKAFLNDLPEKMEAAAEIAQSFDPNQFMEVIRFAQSANGGNPVPTLVK